MRLLITGGSGFLGSHLMRWAKEQHETFATFFSRPCENGFQLDVRDATAVQRLFAQLKPEAVIHTAYDKARHDVIVQGSANIAHATQQQGVRLVHLSTDVVFSGRRGGYREEDAPDPVTDYGRFKAEAEQQVMQLAPHATLTRTSLIYGLEADNPQDLHTQFVLDGLRQQRAVTLFTDELRCPIFVGDLARALLELLHLPHKGVLHLVGAERMSRYEFGVLLARYHGYEDLQSLVATTTVSTGMVRPLDCTLVIDKARALLQTPLRGAREVLGRDA